MQRPVNSPDNDWLTAAEVCRWLGDIGDTLLKKLIREGKFPPGVRLSHNTVRWNWMDVVAYAHLASRIPGWFGPPPVAGDAEEAG